MRPIINYCGVCGSVNRDDGSCASGRCSRSRQFDVYALKQQLEHPFEIRASDIILGPNESAKRKGMPLFSGCMAYFPDALLAIAEHSRKANDKHNPGQPLHWSKDKSKDHADCIARHLVDIGPNWDDTDPEFGSYHATALAWRALALLQTVIERKKAGK